jgi:hypothetical protein
MKFGLFRIFDPPTSSMKFPLQVHTLKHNATRVSMYVAFVAGILLPILETIRRWDQLAELRYFITWFDDYIIGGFLFFGAWKTYKSMSNGVRYLIAAWGFSTGMCFYSFFGQLQAINEPDPGPLSSSAVVLIKGVMFLICISCLIFSLNQRHAK